MTQFLISCLLLIIANIFWGLHDCYFWDQKCRSYVKKKWKGWHVVKSFMKLFLFASILLLDIQAWQIIGFLLIWWGSFELGMFFATMDHPYPSREPTDDIWHRMCLEWYLSIPIILIGVFIGIKGV